MKFLVVTLAPTLKQEDSYASYAPYVREMDLWFSKVSEVTIVSPTQYSKKLLTTSFLRKDIRVRSISELTFGTFKGALRSLFSIPMTLVVLFQEMKKADHIHLRCPGNIGLLGCLVQILFPKKKKTAKYAGNWNPASKQPLSYRFQKWILSNTFLTKNMQVLVYGEWPNQTKNIKSFFTATYPASKIEPPRERNFTAPFRFIFVGSLSSGKRPLYAIQIVQSLIEKGVECRLDFYGDGDERNAIEIYIEKHALHHVVVLHGNVTSESVEEAYKQADFMVLPSKSEGWPKVVAEAMFWGAIPLVPKISCVPWMLDRGNRGFLLDVDIDKDISNIVPLLKDSNSLLSLSRKAKKWSQNYTLDFFETEISKLLQK
ncbi:glycosyltransferase family 4 protein [Ulvibacter litoralis]|uniref:Glycosyltransferase involved in cell wall bisynthesis n=1 Tax=Ulvibacter litoralis TaxID=227084 RepID=A0A1G7GWG2_9FLAO|nr:glycosyltransferase [Ulvibacter litoralis]GHC59886.1 glycosyl transferase [Ulvibacter litoralis]SDE92441.1 Glycosyltransferase involved in cell wall bisynthesis [Ulvibacter litoralis]